MVAELHGLHFHFMVSVWSKFDTNTKFYKDMLAKGMLIPGTNWFDAYSPAARAEFYRFSNESMFNIDVDALWLASVSAAAIVAAFARVNVAPYGLGGSTTHLAAIEAEMRDGPIFHMGLAIYRFSYSTFLLVLLFALPALLAPFAQWIVNVRDRWSRRNASDRPTEF